MKNLIEFSIWQSGLVVGHKVVSRMVVASED